MMRTLVLVDYSNTLYKSMHVHSNLFYKGVPTGGVYGFIAQIAKLVEDTEASHLLVCCDAKPYKRAELYPALKGNRKLLDEQTKTMFSVNRNLVNQFLETANIPIWSVRGYEADDLLYVAAARYRHRFDRIVIRSNDSDVFQAFELHGRAEICFSRNTKEKAYFTGSDFMSEYGVSPDMWPWVAALAGSHNGVRGIDRVGPKTAVKILNTGCLDQYKKSHPFVIGNYRICKLPLDTAIQHAKIPSVVPRLGYRRTVNFLSSLGIRVTPSMDTAFQLLSDGGGRHG